MISGLMFHSADWYRANLGQDATNAQYHTGDTLVQRAVPCCIQPATAKEAQFYYERSQEITHVIYTEATGFLRNDRLVYGSRTFYVVGVRNLIELGWVTALDCVEFVGADQRE